MAKHLFISDLTPGENISDIFLLSSAAQGQARNGPYWRLELKDSSGSIAGKVWSPLSLEYTEMPVGTLLRISGRVGSYRDKAELAVTGIETLPPDVRGALVMADFIPSSPHDPYAMLTSLKALCERELVYRPWHSFLFGLLEDEDIAARLLLAPAAKNMHHAYAGGLLEHTLSVSRLCLMLADHYPSLDRQLLLAGAICHDLGKIWELTSGMTVDYTDAGRLIGHITLVLDHIRPFIEASGLDASLALHLQHLILSHHGTLEFGSPKLPATAEAFILHYADNIDAKMQQLDTALSSVAEGPGWSAYVPGLDRFLYRAQPSPTALPEENIHAAAPAEEMAEPFFEEPCSEDVLQKQEEPIFLPPEAESPPWETSPECVPDSAPGWEQALPEIPWDVTDDDTGAADLPEGPAVGEEGVEDSDGPMTDDESLPFDGVLMAEQSIEGQAAEDHGELAPRQTDARQGPQPLSLLAQLLPEK